MTEPSYRPDEPWRDFLGDVTEQSADDRPVPELGTDDIVAAMALAAATRAMLTATSVGAVVVALSQFVYNLGGEVLPFSLATDPLPLDIAFGVCGPLVAVAEPLSVARMRLEQLLPLLVEDARVAVARLRSLGDADRPVAPAADVAPERAGA